MPDAMVVDLSHWNTVDDFDAIASAGIVGVIHKATEGADVVDPTYAQRRAAARESGLMWGAYHFLRPGDMQAQAQFFVSTAQPDDGTLLAADHEDAGVSLDDLKTFLHCVQFLTSRSPVLYSGNVLKEQLGSAHDLELSQYRLWIAQYAPAPTWPTAVWPTWWLWQFSGSWLVPGISGNVDASAYQRGSDDLMDEWAGAPPQPVLPEDQTVSIDITVPPDVRLRVSVNGLLVVS